MLAPEAQRALIGWEPVNSRIITAKFITKKKDINLNIIQCYAPTNDAEEEKKDDFYQQLQTVIDRGGAKDMTILMGDFNAKIGSDNTGYEDTMGTHGLGQMNENGERFANFCALNQLVIGGSIFPHKRIHKATWRSPDHVTENQIDHICISRKFRRSWRDVRVMRGADVSSDHHLLATTLRLRLKRHTNANNTRTRYNVGLLRNTETQAAFRISLSNRFQPLQDLIEDSEMDIETHWEHSKKLWHDTCEEVLGKRTTQHKEWISADTIQKLEVRKKKKTALNTSRTRRAKAKAQEEYTAADREVKRSTRKDKRDYIDNLANQAEEAARQGNLKDLYQVTKKLAGKFQQTDKPVKDKNGHPLTTTEEQLKRWAEHFRELLNRPIPETPPDIPPGETELPINCDKPSKAEIRKAIMTLRNGKAAGPDDIPAEAIKADTETVVNMLHSLFSKIWEKEEVPAQWKEGIVIKLPKKGDLRDCSNYRGIMLLSVPGKVLNRILLERMREAVDPMLRDQQAGFRRNRSCADQIASLRIIVEQSLEWNSPLYINFIDYEKAFDSVDREALWKLLRHYGVPGKIISLIRCTYQDMSCRIAHAGQLSESFEVKTGVRQGCLLSPFLFLLVIDWIMKTTTAGRKNGIQWTLWTQLDDLDFADDLALLSHSHSQMQDKTTRLEATSAGTGLKINRKKTELMKINTTANTPVTVGGEPIREVESFVYLGSVVDGQGGTDRDVTARIGKARAAMVMLKNVWASKVVSIRTKLRIFNSNVKSVLLYGCETWRTTKTMQQKIQTFLNTCLRRIFNIRWPEKIRNEELWERAGQEPVAKQILRRKWGWIGHTLRKPASSTTRQALTWNPQGKRKRGRPRNSWRRDTEAELCKQGTNWTGVARLAQNRDEAKENEKPASQKEEVLDGDFLKEKAENWESQNKMTVGELWVRLLQFYCLKFDNTRYVVSIRQQHLLSRQEKRWHSKKLAIEDPFSPKKNLASSMANTLIFEYFQSSLRKAYNYFGLPRDADGSSLVCIDSLRQLASRRTDELLKENQEPEKAKDDSQASGDSSKRSASASKDALKKSESVSTEADEGSDDGEAVVIQPNKSISERLRGVSGSFSNESALEMTTSECDITSDSIVTLSTNAESEAESNVTTASFCKDESETDTDVDSVAVICGYCEKEGHIKANCPDDKLPSVDPLPPMLPRHMDIDVTETIEAVATKLMRKRGLYNVVSIPTAKVPIVKFTDRNTKLEGDISLYNILAQRNTRLLYCYSQIDPRVRQLGYAVKVFAKLHRGPDRPEVIVEGCNTWFFDDIPNLHHVWPGFRKNNQSPGALWLGFLRYYLEVFDWKGWVVTIRQKDPLTKFEKLWNGQTIAVEDPFDLNHNLGGGLSRKMNNYIYKTFVNGRMHFGTPFERKLELFQRFRSPEEYFFNIALLSDGKPPNDRGCRMCGKIGHMVKDCPQRQKRKGNQQNQGKEKEKEGTDKKGKNQGDQAANQTPNNASKKEKTKGPSSSPAPGVPMNVQQLFNMVQQQGGNQQQMQQQQIQHLMQVLAEQQDSPPALAQQLFLLIQQQQVLQQQITAYMPPSAMPPAGSPSQGPPLFQVGDSFEE
nr:hypothetical protein BaRGS_024814 [Batillaria attramentaria]